MAKVLAIDEPEADKAACQMEHSVPRQVLERLLQYVEFVDLCPRGGYKWVADLGFHCGRDDTTGACEKCIAVTLDEARKTGTDTADEDVMAGEQAAANVARLSDLKPDEKGMVRRVRSQGVTQEQIAEMGMVPGALVEVERVAPLGDPIEVKVKGYRLSLRKADAEDIDVEVV